MMVAFPDQCKNGTKLHNTITRSKIIETKVRRTDTSKRIPAWLLNMNYNIPNNLFISNKSFISIRPSNSDQK